MSIWNVALVIYGFFAISVGVRLYRNGSKTFDDELSSVDRRLITAVAFHSALPLSLLLHLLGSSALAYIYGVPEAAAVGDFTGKLDAVQTIQQTDAWKIALAALAGPALSLAIALAVLTHTVHRPINAAWNFGRIELARSLFLLELLAYPISAVIMREGSFWVLREALASYAFWLGDLVLFAWVGLPLLLWWLLRANLQRRYLWLATPLFDRLSAAKRAIRKHPRKAESWNHLAGVYLSGQETWEAMKLLKRALEIEPERADTHFLMGMAYLQDQQPKQASEHLRQAGTRIQSHEVAERTAGGKQRELYFEVLLGLAAARLALGDPDGAVQTAKEAQHEKPGDLRSSIVWADALLATGKLEEAKSRLEAALRRADGILSMEIQRRLKSLG